MFIERAWVVECSRCANEGRSDEARQEDALTDFRIMGWTNENGSNYCPQCNGVR